MDQKETKGQESQVPPTAETVEGQAPEQSPKVKQQDQFETAEEFLARTGFKSLADAAKSFKEAQAKITKQGQKLSQLEQALQGTYSQGKQAYQPPVKNGQGSEDFFDDPEGHVQKLARQIAAEEVSGRIQELEARQSISRVRTENPARFDALRPIVQQIYIEKPYLNNLGEMGLRQALDEASERRQQYLADLKAEMFPDQENNQNDIKDQVRNQVLKEQERARQATIPQTGASRPIINDVKKKINEKIESGDIDGLLDLKFPTQQI